MVDSKGIEPSTSRMRTERSPSWATSPCCWLNNYTAAGENCQAGFEKSTQMLVSLKNGRRTPGKRNPGNRQRPLSCLPGQEYCAGCKAEVWKHAAAFAGIKQFRKQNTHDPQRRRPSVRRSFYNKSTTIKQRQFMACGLQKSAYIDRRIIFAYDNNVYMIK